VGIVQPNVLEVRDLRVYYHTPRGAAKAVDGVSFDLRQAERIGLVGESGSGKTTIALALMRMIRPPGKIEGGSVLMDGVDLLAQSEEGMRRLRLKSIAMVAQGAMNSLNPVLRVREQFADALRDHGERLSKAQLDERIGDLLSRVGLNTGVADMFPHELSGGMKQRVCIAIAICMNPKVILADEPTSALDVVVQRQVMETLRNVQTELRASVILVGHDMGLMAQAVDRLGVMYAGTLAELSDVPSIFADPLHPYSQLLIASLPSLDKKGVFQGIPGLPPSLLSRPVGCSFAPRCPYAMPRCTVEAPPLAEVRPDRWVACHLYDTEQPPTDVGAARTADGAAAARQGIALGMMAPTPGAPTPRAGAPEVTA
jgi:oligopeptide/dipeptide ABC transporter ATP-binding protein